MSPKEKAIDLVNKMLFCYQGHIDEYTAKQCALIAVDEILNVTAGLNGWIGGFQSYWEEVKQEIEKL
jgi:hypothetical protein